MRRRQTVNDLAKSESLRLIIKGCKQGQNGSFSELVELYSVRLYGYFYRLTGKKAISEDLLSELFVKLIEKIGSYRGGNFEAWLFRIASNIYYDYLREKKRQSGVIDAQKLMLGSRQTAVRNPGSLMEDKLQNQLEKIDPEIRELIVLRFYSQMSFREIAELRAEPLGTVLSKMHRGLKKLRELMES